MVNSQPHKHGDGDIIAIAASTLFTLVVTNPWLIIEHTCPWGCVFFLEEGRQGVYNCRSNAVSGGIICHGADEKIVKQLGLQLSPPPVPTLGSLSSIQAYVIGPIC